MKIVEVKDVSKRIVIEFTYEEWFEHIYLLEREKRENINLPLSYGEPEHHE